MRRTALVVVSALLVLALILAGCSDIKAPINAPESQDRALDSKLVPAIAGQERIPDSYIVTFSDDVREIKNAARDVAGIHSLKLGHVYEHSMRGFSATIPANRLNLVLADPRIASVEPDYIVYAYVQTLPWGIDRIDADVSSTLAGNGGGTVTGVRIYIIDTGIQLNHPDLNVAGSVDFTGKGTADDGHGHGTHVAGTVAAIDNDGQVVGVAPGAQVYAVKVLGDNGSGSTSNVIKGVDYVTQQKQAAPGTPMVANMSLGSFVGTTSYGSLDNAVLNSINRGVVYTIAAGNSGRDARLYSPAHVTQAITVGAYDSNNNFASFSNYGSLLDINAPGVSILSTYKGSATATMSGTSMASPHVGGAAALLLSGNPTLTPQQVRDRLVADGKSTVSTSRRNTTKLTVYAGSY
jgi:subtilisin family serine protease